MKQPLIVLTGPTASGKTALSIGLAKAIGGEIISADSMQVYRQMDIGTAKIRPEEMEGIPHYLVDVLEPDASFNVVIFQQMAAFVSPNVLNYLVENFGIAPITTPEEDLKQLLK